MPRWDFQYPADIISPCKVCGNKPSYYSHALWWELKCQCGQRVNCEFAYDTAKKWNKNKGGE
jgi:hypothetical protein